MSQETPFQKALTPQEVADILQISKNMVYELIKRGELNGYRVGNKLRVDLDDVQVYKNATKNTKTESAPAEVPTPPVRNPLLYEHTPYENSFVICGQDLILDILARRLEQDLHPSERILRSYVGSYNGLYSLYNDEVQAATAHLWDGRTNQYNVPYVERMLPGVSSVVINLAFRMQGFYVLAGNPKGIHDWEDLRREDITIVNREKGSGTRILLDEHLRLLGISPGNLRGYGRECRTHLAVAGVVARGGADVAIGNEKIAMQVNRVEFIPLQKEQYDLVIKKENLTNPLYKYMIDIIRSADFKDELAAIGGYDLSLTGTVIAET